MNMQQIRAIARDRGMKLGTTEKKADIIRAIQRDEGNSDCFGRADSHLCDQENCLWRADCVPSQKKTKAA